MSRSLKLGQSYNSSNQQDLGTRVTFSVVLSIFREHGMKGLAVVGTFIHIVDGDKAAVIPMPRSALLTAPNGSNVLIRPPKIVAADGAVPLALDEDATATGLVTPAVAG
jgi:hypothetical protein